MRIARWRDGADTGEGFVIDDRVVAFPDDLRVADVLTQGLDAAHALFARPLVVGPRSRLAVEVLERSPAAGLVTLDGRRRLEVPHGARVEVTRSAIPVRLARLSPAPFTTRLVNKFDLPVDGWRGRPSAPRPTFPRSPEVTP